MSTLLTEGQWRVARAFAIDGCDNATIARRLELSEETVKTHMKMILAKSVAPSRTALAVGIWSGHECFHRLRGQISEDLLDTLREVAR